MTTAPRTRSPFRVDPRPSARAYWFERLRDRYERRYGLRLDPRQYDNAFVPPAELVGLIQDPAKASPDVFFAEGYRNQLMLLDELEDHGVDPCALESVLEFGCGLSRVLRHWLPFSARLTGCDVTPAVAAYSKSLMGGDAAIECTGLTPPLPYADRSFDVLYAISVFTHIRRDAAEQWVSELARVLRPGATAIVTTFDINFWLPHVEPHVVDEALRTDGAYEWGDDTVLERFSYLDDAGERARWGGAFDLLEIRHHHAHQRHLIMRRR